MTFHSLIPSRSALGMLCGMALAAGFFMTPARADEWNKMTVLTVNQPIQITDTVLEPGQYVLKLYDSPSNRHVVEIFNRDQTHIINTVIAIPTERLQPTGRTQFTFWETPPGSYRALRMWYYPGDNYGQEFRYPKHLQQVAMVTQTTTAEAQPAPPSPAASTEPAETPAPEPAPAEQQAEQQPEQPAEVAQNTAPPAETPAPAPEQQPAQLPKTGSLYPEIGLAGLALLGLAGLLRLRRTA
jgi:LPXTG-motif cell wall-anchored protein